MATDFPVPPVDRLPIFADEASSAAILMEMVRGRGPAEVDSVGGSRWGMVDAAASAGAGVNGAAYGEQVSVDAEGGAVSDFNESEGDNADAFEHGGARAEKAAIDSALGPSRECRCSFSSFYRQDGSTGARLD